MNSVYDKAENYLISMAADERVQKLFQESEREKAMDIDYVQKLIIQARNLEPAIQDIALLMETPPIPPFIPGKNFMSLLIKLPGTVLPGTALKRLPW